jgi:hypothetical protein
MTNGEMRLRELRDKWRAEYPLSTDMDHSYAIHANAVWNCANELDHELEALAAPVQANATHFAGLGALADAVMGTSVQADAVTDVPHGCQGEPGSATPQRVANETRSILESVQAEVGAGDYFADNNKNIRNAQQFHEDVEFIHAAHIEGGLDVACRDVFTRRERMAFEAGLHAQAARPDVAGYKFELPEGAQWITSGTMSEREQLAGWMIERSFATGHGDKFADLLNKLSWQVAELRARAALAGERAEEAASARPLEAGKGSK